MVWYVMYPKLKLLGLSLLATPVVLGTYGRMTHPGAGVPHQRNDLLMDKSHAPVALGGSPALTMRPLVLPPEDHASTTEPLSGKPVPLAVAALWYHGNGVPVKADAGLKPLKRWRFLPGVNAWASAPEGAPL